MHREVDASKMAAVACETSHLLLARRHDDIGHDNNEDDTDGMHTTSRNDRLLGTATTSRIEEYAATADAAISRSSTTVSTTEDDDEDIEGDYYGGSIGRHRSCGGGTCTVPPPTRPEVVVDHQAVLSWPLALAVLVAVLTQLLVGYNIGVMNAPEPVVFPGHGTTAWSWAVASFALGAPFGARHAGAKADERGRKSTILSTARLFLVGGLLQSLAPTLWVIALARFLIGFASGCSSVLVPIYLGELAPHTWRGTLGTATQLAIVLGILLSNLASFPLARAAPLWRLLFGVNVVAAGGIIGLGPWLLESPRWLLQRDERSPEARTIIRALRKNTRHDDERLVVEMEVEFLLTTAVIKTAGSGLVDGASSLTDIWTDPTTRSLLIGALVVHVAQQLSGINAVFFYSNSFFQGVIPNSLVGTTIVGVVNVLATYGALLVMESTNRRTLLLVSSGGMLVCAVVLIMALQNVGDNHHNHHHHLVALGAVTCYVVLFEVGLGPIPWLIVPELFASPQHVAAAIAAATQLNWISSFVVSLTFPSLQKALGAYSFAPFAVCLALTFLYTLFLLPETRGKTPQQVYQHLELVSAQRRR